MNNEKLLENLRCIPDFPQKGVNFRDVTTLFKDPECLKIMVDELYELYKDKGITKIVGIESRGFVLSSALALKLNAGVVLCRKPGKLPAETIQESYSKEYGKDTIEIHKDAITEDDVVLLHDDLLATGGTMRAAYNLVKKFNPKNIYVNFIIELVHENLNGRANFEEGTDITSLTEGITPSEQRKRKNRNISQQTPCKAKSRRQRRFFSCRAFLYHFGCRDNLSIYSMVPIYTF